MIRKSKDHFWDWFERNNTEYLQLLDKSESEQAYWLKELETHIEAHGKFMRIGVMHRDDDEEKATLVISADGRKKHFNKIDSLVAKAPKIPCWNIHALMQPQEIDFRIEEKFGITGIDPCDLWFTPSPGDGNEEVDVIVYSAMRTKKNAEVFELIAVHVMYNLLGERSFALDIGYIDTDNLSRAPKDTELIKLEELPAYLGNRRSPFAVDGSGNLVARY